MYTVYKKILTTFPVLLVSEDSLLDGTSSIGADNLDPTDEVGQWVRHAASSGIGTMSTSSHFQDPNSLKDDIPIHKHNPSDMDSMKYTTEPKHTRSLSF